MELCPRKVLQAVIEACTALLQEETGVEVGQTLRFNLPPSSGLDFDRRDVVILVGITGDIEGVVGWVMREESALILASRLGGCEYAVLDSWVESILSEFGNISVGNAAGWLEAQGTVIRPLVPTIIRGRNNRVGFKRGLLMERMYIMLAGQMLETFVVLSGENCYASL